MRKEIFNNESETTFADANCDFCMHLSNRERASLVLDKRVSGSKSVFDNVHDWTNCQNELKNYHAKNYVQSKAHEREKQKIADNNEHSEEHA